MRLFLFLVFFIGSMSGTAIAQPENPFGALQSVPYFTVFSPLPAEIDFADKPTRILIAPLYKVDQLKVARDKKEELIQSSLDVFLRTLSNSMQAGMPQVEILLDRDPFQIEGYPGNKESITSLLKKHHADLLFGIDQFRPQVEKAGVEVVETPGGSKDRTATYLISAAGTLQIYSSDSLLRRFSFYTAAFLKERKVVSGLLAAGPSLVNNAEEALAVSEEAARKLAKRMLPSESSFIVRKFTMKEFRAFNRYMDNGDIASATAEVLNLISGSSKKVKGRGHVMMAMLYHKKGDIDAALAEVDKAIPLTDAGAPELYRDFLVKYSSVRLIRWK